MRFRYEVLNTGSGNIHYRIYNTSDQRTECKLLIVPNVASYVFILGSFTLNEALQIGELVKTLMGDNVEPFVEFETYIQENGKIVLIVNDRSEIEFDSEYDKVYFYSCSSEVSRFLGACEFLKRFV